MFFKSSNGWFMKNASVQKIRCRRNGQGGMGGMDTHRRAEWTGGMDTHRNTNDSGRTGGMDTHRRAEWTGGMDTHRKTNDSGRNGHASQYQRFRMDRSVIPNSFSTKWFGAEWTRMGGMDTHRNTNDSG
jgi:hypothetical protein